jgi:hypothetical protein
MKSLITVSVLLLILCADRLNDALADCYPAKLEKGINKLPYYSEKNIYSIEGTVTKNREAGLKLCYIQGEWARVKIDFSFYWMKAQYISVNPQIRKKIETSLPVNRNSETTGDFCNEAITKANDSFLYTGYKDHIKDVIAIPYRFPLLACLKEDESDEWIEIRYETPNGWQEGWMEPEQVYISPEVRPKNLGFREKELCQDFVWAGRTTEEVSILRWELNDVIEVYKVPQDMEVTAKYLEGNWLWINFGGIEGYVPAKSVFILAMERVNVDHAIIKKCGYFRTGIAKDREKPVYNLEWESNQIATIPAGAEFAVLDWEGKRWQIRYLGVEGWIDPADVSLVTKKQPLKILWKPPELNIAALELYNENIHASKIWNMQVLLGAAISNIFNGIPFGFQPDLGMKVSRIIQFHTGLHVFLGENQTLIGPDILSSLKIFSDNKDQSELHFLTGFGCDLFKNRARSYNAYLAGFISGLAFKSFLSAYSAFVLDYRFRISYMAYCSKPENRDDIKCLNDNYMFSHTISAGISMYF